MWQTWIAARAAVAAASALLMVSGAVAVQAPAATMGQVDVTEVVAGLEYPWAVAFLPDGALLITERPGRLRMLTADGALSDAIAGVPDVVASGQGGLLDVVLSPDFANDRLVYLSYAEAGDKASGTAIGRGRLSEQADRIDDFTVIFRQEPKLSSGLHFGSRMVFGADGLLYITLGENNQRPTAQDLDKLQGKIVRLKPDGSVPDDNPFVQRDGARAEIWSYGHRNPQGLAINPWTGDLWEHEHGPRGGDEVNIIQAGKNYGWPLATYGINYSGFAIPEAQGESAAGTEQPLVWWKKSPAISGMAFYDHRRYPQWDHSLFIGALADKVLIRQTLDGDKVVAEERLLHDRKERIRDVRTGPDGDVYVLTDSSDASLLRLAPAH